MVRHSAGLVRRAGRVSEGFCQRSDEHECHLAVDFRGEEASSLPVFPDGMGDADDGHFGPRRHLGFREGAAILLRDGCPVRRFRTGTRQS